MADTDDSAASPQHFQAEINQLRQQLHSLTEWLDDLEKRLPSTLPAVELPREGVPLPVSGVQSKEFGSSAAEVGVELPVIPPPVPALPPSVAWPDDTSERLPAMPADVRPPLPPLRDPEVEQVVPIPVSADHELRLTPVPVSAVPSPPPVPQAPPAMQVPSHRPSQPVKTPTQPPLDWEALIGGRWMTWLGAFILLLALGFTVHWAYMTFEAPPWAHVLAFHLAGAALIGGGYFLNTRKLPIAAQAITGLGIFELFASAYATLHLYQLWSPQVAFVECSLLTLMAIALALAYDSPGVILLGALGGYLTPLLTSTGSANYVGLFSYLAFLNVALLGSAVWRGWSFLKPLALGATALLFGAWVLSPQFGHLGEAAVWGTEWFVALHAGLFLVGSTIPPVLWRRPSDYLDCLALSASSLGFIGGTWWLFHSRPEQQLALVSWGLAALHAALFAVTYARVTLADRMPRVHLALAAVFFTLAIPLQIDNTLFWGATWAIEALIFMAVGSYYRDRQMQVSALIVAALSAGRLLLFDAEAGPRLIGGGPLDLRYVMFMVAGLVGLACSELPRFVRWVRGQPRFLLKYEQPLVTAFLAIGALLVTVGQYLQFGNGSALGLAWGVETLAFAVLAALLANDRQQIVAFITAVLTCLRLLVWEFEIAEPTASVSHLLPGYLQFCGAGVLLIAAAEAKRFFSLFSGNVQPEEEFDGTHRIALSAMGTLLITAAQPTLWGGSWTLGLAWSIEALVIVVAAILLRSHAWFVMAELVFGSAAAWLMIAELDRSAKQLRVALSGDGFNTLLICGLMMLAGAHLPRLLPRLLRRPNTNEADDVHVVPVMTWLGTALVTLAMPARYGSTPYLGVAWGLEGLAFVALGVLSRDVIARYTGVAVLALAGIRVLGVDWLAVPELTAHGWNAHFLALEAAMLLAFVAGGLLYYTRNLVPEKLRINDLAVAAGLLGVANIIALLGLLAQWNGHVALTVWCVDVGLIWFLAFRWQTATARFYALALGLFMVGCLAIYNGYVFAGEYRLIFNPRFGTLGLVAALYFGAGYLYRGERQAGRLQPVHWPAIDVTAEETYFDQILGVLGNVVAVAGLTMEVHHYYANAIAQGLSPFPDMRMAEMATYSIVWAVYAALMVACGFALRYPLFRYLGLGAFGLIVLKVFFIDLSHLRWLPRVLALAVLGLMLIGVSILYQKFLARVAQPDNDDGLPLSPRPDSAGEQTAQQNEPAQNG